MVGIEMKTPSQLSTKIKLCKIVREWDSPSERAKLSWISIISTSWESRGWIKIELSREFQYESMTSSWANWSTLMQAVILQKVLIKCIQLFSRHISHTCSMLTLAQLHIAHLSQSKATHSLWERISLSLVQQYIEIAQAVRLSNDNENSMKSFLSLSHKNRTCFALRAKQIYFFFLWIIFFFYFAHFIRHTIFEVDWSFFHSLSQLFFSTLVIFSW